MATWLDNRWQSLTILLSIIGCLWQPILAGDDYDVHSVSAKGAVPRGLGASRPMKIPTPSTVQAYVKMNTTRNKVENGSSHPESIVGGDAARPGDWPWMVVVRAGISLCGGTLIDENHVLTAWHCTVDKGPSKVVVVQLGDYDIHSNDETRHVERLVREIVYPKRNPEKPLMNDIAILTMVEPVQFTPAIQPVRLPSGSELYTGKEATIIGWGSTEDGGPASSMLRQTTSTIISNSECASKVLNSSRILDTSLCDLRPGTSSCKGDSGGPVMVKEGGKWIQVGIVSWGDECGSSTIPSVNTRVSRYMRFIRRNLK